MDDENAGAQPDAPELAPRPPQQADWVALCRGLGFPPLLVCRAR